MSDRDRAMVPRDDAAIRRALEAGNPRVTRGLARLDSLDASASKVGTIEAMLGDFGSDFDDTLNDPFVDVWRPLFPRDLAFDEQGERLLVCDTKGFLYIFDRHYHNLIDESQSGWLGERYGSKNLVRWVDDCGGGWAIVSGERLQSPRKSPLTFEFTFRVDLLYLGAENKISTLHYTELVASGYTFNVSIIDDGIIFFDKMPALEEMSHEPLRVNVLGVPFYVASESVSNFGFTNDSYNPAVQVHEFVYCVNRNFNNLVRKFVLIELWKANGERVHPVHEFTVEGFIIDMVNDGELIYTIESNTREWKNVHSSNPNPGVKFRIAAYNDQKFLGSFEPQIDYLPIIPTAIDITSKRIAIALRSSDSRFLNWYDDDGVAVYSNGSASAWKSLPDIDGWISNDIRLIWIQTRWDEILSKAVDPDLLAVITEFDLFPSSLVGNDLFVDGWEAFEVSDIDYQEIFDEENCHRIKESIEESVSLIVGEGITIRSVPSRFQR